jgi:hypothetical protein
MEAAGFSETLAPVYWGTGRNVPPESMPYCCNMLEGLQKIRRLKDVTENCHWCLLHLLEAICSIDGSFLTKYTKMCNL